MGIKQHLIVRSSVLRGHVNRYALLGLVISICSIAIASVLVSYQMTGFIDFRGIILAQETNPALWALDLTPFMFAYWGQSFCYELANSMETMLEDKTRELVNKSSDLELKLQHETNHDHLTNLPNLRLFSQRINQGIAQIHKGEELAVIILHINSFKEMNYKYGSFNANNILIQFAEKLKTILLEPFLLLAYMGMNMVARLQGAEFAILIPRLKKEHNLDVLINKLLESTCVNCMIDGNSINITTVCGVALYPMHGDNDNTLLQHASTSLFFAEKEGLSHAIYHTGMNKGVSANSVEIQEISSEIENETISLIYQPCLDLKTQQIIGVEAIVHFDNSKLGIMYPDKLTPLVEGTVWVKKLTTLVLREAVKQLVLWHQANYKIYITVNLFDVTDTNLASFIDSLLKENNISPEYLKVELTEKACLSDQTRSMVVLNQLSEIGIKIGISDFCSGYSSFIYLTNFPISELKIDKSFIVNMLNDEKKLSIVQAVIKIAEAMNIAVFADGVTDQKMMKKIKQFGCLYAQGPYFSLAVPADDITALLSKAS